MKMGLIEHSETDKSYFSNALTLLIKIILCSEFRFPNGLDKKRFHMKFITNVRHAPAAQCADDSRVGTSW